MAYATFFRNIRLPVVRRLLSFRVRLIRHVDIRRPHNPVPAVDDPVLRPRRRARPIIRLRTRLHTLHHEAIVRVPIAIRNAHRPASVRQESRRRAVARVRLRADVVRGARGGEDAGKAAAEERPEGGHRGGDDGEVALDGGGDPA